MAVGLVGDILLLAAAPLALLIVRGITRGSASTSSRPALVE
jgi:hypothetical protein